MDVNPYESPREQPLGPSTSLDPGPWRDGRLLVCRADSKSIILPPWCAATGVGPLETPPVTEMFDVTPPFRIAFASQYLTLSYRLAPSRRRRLSPLASSLVGLLGLAIVTAVSIAADRLTPIPGILAGGFTGLMLSLLYVVQQAGAYTARVVQQQGGFVWFQGFHGGVLARLPDWSTANPV